MKLELKKVGKHGIIIKNNDKTIATMSYTDEAINFVDWLDDKINKQSSDKSIETVPHNSIDGETFG